MNFVPKNMLVLALVAVASAHADGMPLRLTIRPEGQRVDLRIESSKPTADECLEQFSRECRDSVLAKTIRSGAMAELPDSDIEVMPTEATLEGVFPAEEPVDVAQLQGILLDQANVDDQITHRMLDEIAWELENKTSVDVNAENIMPAADVAMLPVWQESFPEVPEVNAPVEKIWEEAFSNTGDVAQHNDSVVSDEPFWLESFPTDYSVKKPLQEAFFDKDKIDAGVSGDKVGGAAMTTIAASKLQGYYESLQARVPSIDKAKLYDNLWFGAKVAGVVFVGYMGYSKLKAWLTKGVTDAERELSNAGGSSSVNNSTAPAQAVARGENVGLFDPTNKDDASFWSETQQLAPNVAGGAGTNPVVIPNGSEPAVVHGSVDVHSVVSSSIEHIEPAALPGSEELSIQRDFKHNPEPQVNPLYVDMLPDSDASVAQQGLNKRRGSNVGLTRGVRMFGGDIFFFAPNN